MVRVSLLRREENPSLHLTSGSRPPGGSGQWEPVCHMYHHTSEHGGNGQGAGGCTGGFNLKMQDMGTTSALLPGNSSLVDAERTYIKANMHKHASTQHRSSQELITLVFLPCLTTSQRSFPHHQPAQISLHPSPSEVCVAHCSYWCLLICITFSFQHSCSLASIYLSAYP